MARFKRDEQRTSRSGGSSGEGSSYFFLPYGPATPSRHPGSVGEGARSLLSKWNTSWPSRTSSASRTSSRHQKADVDKLKARKKELTTSSAGQIRGRQDQPHPADPRVQRGEQAQTLGKRISTRGTTAGKSPSTIATRRKQARKALEEADRAEGRKKADAMLADPPAPPPKPGVTAEMRHLEEEIARNSRRAQQIGAALGTLPAKVREAWSLAKEVEELVTSKLRVEVDHQGRIDKAVADMVRLEGRRPGRQREDEKLVVSAVATCARPPPCGRRGAASSGSTSIRRQRGGEPRASHRQGRTPGRRCELRPRQSEERAHPSQPQPAHHVDGGAVPDPQVVTHCRRPTDVDREAATAARRATWASTAAITRAPTPGASSALTRFRKDALRDAPGREIRLPPCHQGQGRATDRLPTRRTTTKKSR